MINFISETSSSFTLSKVIGLMFLVAVLSRIIKRFYDAFISPLSLIPGPKICSLSEFSIIIRRPEGRLFEWFYQLHRKYGSVVRVGPKFILFSDKEAVRKILVTNVCINGL